MVTNVIFFAGSFYAAVPLAHFCSLMREDPRVRFVVHPYTLPMRTRSATMEKIEFFQDEAAYFQKYLEAIPQETETLVIIGGSLYRRPDALAKLCNTVHGVFPDAYRAIFCSPVPQYRETEATYAISSFFDARRSQEIGPWYATVKKNYDPNYATFWGEAVSLFGKESVTFLPFSSPSMHPREVIIPFLQHLGIHLPDDDALFALEPLLCALPAPLISFICTVNRVLTFYAEEGLPGWGEEVYRIQRNTLNAQADDFPLLSREERQSIETAFEKANVLTARFSNTKQLFPPECEPAPFPAVPRIPFETVFDVARSLSASFAADLLATFQRVAPYLAYPQERICHEALAAVFRRNVRKTPAQPKVAVLTLTYNQASFIADNIESVLRQQTDFPIQHIIADDGSDDGTQDIILEYSSRHPHILPLFQKTKSAGRGNVKALYSAVRAPYAALCEGDDYFSDCRKLQIQADFLDANPDLALCFHPVRVVFEENPSRNRMYPPPDSEWAGRSIVTLEDILAGNLMQTNSVMYRWRFGETLPPWFRCDLIPGDWYMHILHAEKGNAGFINKAMSVYRRHAAALYYLAEQDNLKLQHKEGCNKLDFFQTVDSHFDGKYRTILFDLASAVFTDLVLYAEKTGDDSALQQAVASFPAAAAYFFDKLDI